MEAQDRQRRVVAIGVAALHAGLIWALIAALDIDVPAQVAATLQLVEVRPDPVPPPRSIAPKKARAPRPKGAAAPPNLRSRATPIVAPPPIVPMTPPPPLVIAAPIAGTASDPTAGAAPVRGPGSGSGGTGVGTGSGDSGTGDGGGGGEIPLRLIKGRIRNSDYPPEAIDSRASGTVGLRFVVGVTGRVTSCTVTRSSGSAALDETTCRLIRERFRYKPTINAQGKPIADTVVGEHEWVLEEEPGRER